MQNFTDSQGRFEFPEHLFPEVPGPRPVPPSVGSRRAAILRGAAAAIRSHREDSASSRSGSNGYRGHRNHKSSSSSSKNSVVTNARTNNDTGSSAGESSEVLKARTQRRDWSRSVLDFHALWSPLPEDMVRQAVEILDVLASIHGDGEAAYALGAVTISVSADAPALVSANDRRSLLRQALKADINRAWYRVGVNSDSRGETESALSRFQRGADRKDSACLYTLGLAYIQGQFGLVRDLERGVNLLELAVNGADSDFPRAPYFVGKIMLGEHGSRATGGLGITELEGHIKQDRWRGLDLIERSAVLGFAPALLRMAEAYLCDERGFDCASALRYLSLAACQEVYRRFNKRAPVLDGAPEAQIVKWLLCGYENVVNKDEEWAFKFAEVSAMDQNASALFALAYFYEVGIATTPDPQRAEALYRMSSERGFSAAKARLDQLSKGDKPQLRRTLTRQDHDAKMRKHYAALMRGDVGAPSAAINDESTLVAQEPAAQRSATPAPQQESQQKPQPIPEPASQPVPAQVPAQVPAPEPVPAPVSQPEPSTVTPYPVSPVASSQNPSASLPTSASAPKLPYPISPIKTRVLPYPTDSPPASPWQSPVSSRPVSEAGSVSSGQADSQPNSQPGSQPGSPRSTSSSLPYPSSPPRREGSITPRSRSPDNSPDRRRVASSIASYRNPTASRSSESIARKPVGSGPDAVFGPPLATNNEPGASTTNNAPSSSTTSSTSNSASGSTPSSSRLPSLAARQGPPLKPVPPPTELLQKTPMLRPNPSNESFRTAASGSPEIGTLPDDRTADVPLASKSTTSVASAGSSGSAGSAGSTGPPSRSNSPRRRPLSAQWVRQSIHGANRFFSSTSLATNGKPTSNGDRSVSPVPSSTSGGSHIGPNNTGTNSATNSVYSAGSNVTGADDIEMRHRSTSPLRKILGSTPEQRAAVSRRDRRSFTEAALAELATAPKVPVQPIKKDRVPGVAYTFEEMGVESIAGDKNDRCLIQ